LEGAEPSAVVAAAAAVVVVVVVVVEEVGGRGHPGNTPALEARPSRSSLGVAGGVVVPYQLA